MLMKGLENGFKMFLSQKLLVWVTEVPGKEKNVWQNLCWGRSNVQVIYM